MKDKPQNKDLQSRVDELEAQLEALQQKYQQVSHHDDMYKKVFVHAPYEIHVWKIVRNHEDKIINWLLVDANPKALASWGEPDIENIIGKTTDQIFTSANPVEFFMPTVEKIFSTNKPVFWEEYFSGTDQTLSMMSIPFDDFFISTGFDISHLKRIQEELLFSYEKAREANEAKTRFLSKMSHDMRTPLNSIIGFTQLMLMNSQKTKLPENISKPLSHVKIAADVLLQLIDNVLDIAKIESGKKDINQQDINLDGFMERIALLNKTQANNKSIGLDISIDPSLPKTIQADAVKLHQIVSNLTENAIKFSPENSSIELKLFKKKDYMVIEVHDRGIGINPEDLKRIFYRFERVEQSSDKYSQGSGLGLAIVKHMVELLNGTIEVNSQPGEGSVFSVTIPLH